MTWLTVICSEPVQCLQKGQIVSASRVGSGGSPSCLGIYPVGWVYSEVPFPLLRGKEEIKGDPLVTWIWFLPQTSNLV